MRPILAATLTLFLTTVSVSAQANLALTALGTITPNALGADIADGFNVHSMDHDGRTALMYAAARNANPAVIAELLKAEARIDAGARRACERGRRGERAVRGQCPRCSSMAANEPFKHNTGSETG